MLPTQVKPTSDHRGQQLLPVAAFAGSGYYKRWPCWQL